MRLKSLPNELSHCAGKYYPTSQTVLLKVTLPARFESRLFFFLMPLKRQYDNREETCKKNEVVSIILLQNATFQTWNLPPICKSLHSCNHTSSFVFASITSISVLFTFFMCAIIVILCLLILPILVPDNCLLIYPLVQHLDKLLAVK